MSLTNYENMPIQRLISFNKLLEYYDGLAKSEDPFLAAKAKRVLDAQAPFPELRDGFEDLNLLDTYKEVIGIILEDTFSDVLSSNEIKTASWPYDNLVFNSSKRFKDILKNAGPGFELKIRNQEEDFNYIMAAVVVLNFHYGFKLDFTRPYFYDIPNAEGVMHHYRILYNADFLELIPTDKAKPLTQDDVDDLLENYDNIELWREKVPPGSFISKGFVISNMFDVTAEHSISEIKSSLIAADKRKSDSFMEHLSETFRSFFRIKNIQSSFVAYNAKENQFEQVHSNGINSVLLNDQETGKCENILCSSSYGTLLEDKTYFAVSDVDKYFTMSKGAAPYKNLKQAGIKSAILAPIADGDTLLGVLELTSTKKNELNSVNATKLDDIMPFIVSAVLRSKIEEANLIDAIIQHECTSVHPAVHWRFEEEAKLFIKDDLQGLQPTFKEIVFKDVYPLYGQIDIKNSSQARNTAIQRDLTIQLSVIKSILLKVQETKKLPFYEELTFRVDNHIDDIKEMLHTNSEQAIFKFVNEEIAPVFAHLKKSESKELLQQIISYEASIDSGTDSFYDHRKNYDESVMRINKKLAKVIDQRQEQAQEMFPHYFERYKTDGVEHNMYIGDAIVPNDSFDPIYINNLRLWQLQVMCEMENVHYNLKPKLDIPLDVASLILVYNTSLSIRFRLDEKRFDVDGTYNARYEIIKKRIDKSFVKGTNERLTQPGKMVVVYSQKSDELEYLRYIKFLKSKGYFTGKVEIVELEGLQGVSGLKAIRADILYTTDAAPEETYTYEDLMVELKA
ncbi:GAF domain-containing protein [Aggregatimonas sangjinii]|uniref:GAF domain-containing protein n=1 Tax=Aggregatimonas sangjinii TaxID=2583587 RepID=A0A5B7SNK7_9FLAO|nr:GAF domain-containing protein [Aggregatimonas sangjinii]QCW98629.1 GAF domain-containing protein [Aggregatimonas sangjinii]